MKTSDIYGGNFLKAEHLAGKTVVVRISEVDIEEFEDDAGKLKKKVVLSFAGKDKKLVVNTTNAAVISENLGSDDTDNWTGKTIALTVKKVEFAGKLVPAIRVVLNDAPKAAAPANPVTPATAPCDDEGRVDSSEVPF